MINGRWMSLKVAFYLALGVIAVLVLINFFIDDRSQPRKVSNSAYESVSLAIIADKSLDERSRHSMLLRANCAKFVAVQIINPQASFQFANSVFDNKDRTACRNMWRGDDSRKCKLFSYHSLLASKYNADDDVMNKALPIARKKFKCV